MLYSKYLTRTLSALAAVLALAALSSAPAHAQYPGRPIKLVVPNQAGTGPDLMARSLSISLATALGQPVVVENKVGANGNIASDFVAKAPADGYTLLIGSDAQVAINPHVYAKLPFNPLTDLLPVATLGSQELFLCVAPALPAKNLREFVDFAKKNATPLSYGSAGNGTQSHLLMELLKTRTGISAQHVPYKGGAAAAVAAMSGEVAAVFGGTSLIPQIQAGKLKVIASTGTRRSSAFPNVPTVAETLPGFEGLLWVGLFAPAGTPPDVLAALRGAVQKYIGSADSPEKLATLGFDPYPTTPDNFRELIKKDYAKYGQLVKAADVKLD